MYRAHASRARGLGLGWGGWDAGSPAEISNTLAGGYLVYASGKLLYGFTTDQIGGKAVFVCQSTCVSPC